MQEAAPGEAMLWRTLAAVRALDVAPAVGKTRQERGKVCRQLEKYAEGG
eukprot:SAG22_NODE_16317_length_328_cov_0.672489_1_plen_49_part_00